MKAKPNAHLVSQRWQGHEHSQAIKDHVANWVRNPDPGSAFERNSAQIRTLPGEQQIRILLGKKYDGFLLEREGKITAQVFFQRHGTEFRVFSIANTGGPLGEGARAFLNFIEWARKQEGIKEIVLGAGGEESTTKSGGHKQVAQSLKNLEKMEKQLNLSIEGHTIKFNEKR